MTRFADGPEVETSLDIAAHPEVVWRLVTDINLPARFQDEFREAVWVDGNGPSLGAAFLGRNERRGHRWETTSTIVAYEPEKTFAWAVNDIDNPAAVWTYHLERTSGGTQLTYHRRIGPGPSGVKTAIEAAPDREEEIIARRDTTHRRNMVAVLEGIKELAEAHS